eukprot:m.64758 g.64758  ORF g.64758 m.64758 type:complete len:249 (-) comp17907_c0_seq2:206-952(-)
MTSPGFVGYRTVQTLRYLPPLIRIKWLPVELPSSCGIAMSCVALTLSYRPTVDHLPRTFRCRYRVRGNTTVAIECFRSVLAMSPSDEEGLLNLCDTLFRLEKWDEAEKVIRHSLTYRAHQRGGPNYFALGRTLLAQGRNTEAIEAFKRCLQLNPNHHSAQAGLAVSRSLVSAPSENWHTILLISLCVIATLIFVKSAVNSGGTNTPTLSHRKSQTTLGAQEHRNSGSKTHGGDRGRSTPQQSESKDDA